MEQFPVSSRIIEAVFFSKQDGRLHIRFVNGEVRLFEGVPAREASALIEARSPGTHYLKCIRDRYTRIA